jgi:hypothetical protein
MLRSTAETGVKQRTGHAAERARKCERADDVPRHPKRVLGVSTGAVKGYLADEVVVQAVAGSSPVAHP